MKYYQLRKHQKDGILIAFCSFETDLGINLIKIRKPNRDGYKYTVYEIHKNGKCGLFSTLEDALILFGQLKYDKLKMHTIKEESFLFYQFYTPPPEKKGLEPYQRDIIKSTFERCEVLQGYLNSELFSNGAISILADNTGLRDGYIREHLEEIINL